MNKNLEDGEAIVVPWISKAIETAQKKVEARNYDIRKQVVEFDDVMNDQRKVIYEQRPDIMDAEIGQRRHQRHARGNGRGDRCRELPGRAPILSSGMSPASRKASTPYSGSSRRSTNGWKKRRSIRRLITERIQQLADEAMAAKLETVEPERWNDVEKQILIQTLDHHWKEHLATLDALRQVIHLRSYAQKKPIDEYKQEAFLLFERLLVSIREEVTRVLMRAQVQLEPPPPPVLPDFITQHLDPFSGDDDTRRYRRGHWNNAVRTSRP